MSRIRTAVTAATICCAVMLAGAATASAQESVPFTKKLAITGTNKGKDFKGTYTIQRFIAAGGKVVAVGTLKGKLKNRKVTRNERADPCDARQGAQSSQLPPNPTPGACQVLEPRAEPDRPQPARPARGHEPDRGLIEAIPGAGNLLGNLLCAITGILDPKRSRVPSTTWPRR